MFNPSYELNLLLSEYFESRGHKLDNLNMLRKKRDIRNKAKKAVGFKQTHYEYNGMKYYKQNGSWYKVPINGGTPIKILKKDVPIKDSDIVGIAQVNNGPKIPMSIRDSKSKIIDQNGNETRIPYDSRRGTTELDNSNTPKFASTKKVPERISISKKALNDIGSDVAASHEYGHIKDYLSNANNPLNDPKCRFPNASDTKEFLDKSNEAYLRTKENPKIKESHILDMDEEEGRKRTFKTNKKIPYTTTDERNASATKGNTWAKPNESIADKFAHENIQTKNDTETDRIDRHTMYLQKSILDSLSATYKDEIHKIKQSDIDELKKKELIRKKDLERKKKLETAMKSIEARNVFNKEILKK